MVSEELKDWRLKILKTEITKEKKMEVFDDAKYFYQNEHNFIEKRKLKYANVKEKDGQWV